MHAALVATDEQVRGLSHRGGAMDAWSRQRCRTVVRACVKLDAAVRARNAVKRDKIVSRGDEILALKVHAHRTIPSGV